MPEFFALLGVDVFLAMSLLTCLLDKRFPGAVPYMYQIAALVGFGHLLISREFMAMFGDYVRFWYCFIYLTVAIANVIVLNVYIGVRERPSTLAKVFFGTATIPIIFVSLFFVSGYANYTTYPLPLLPQIPLEYIFVGLLVCAVVLGIGILLALRPKIVGKKSKKEVIKNESRKNMA